MEKRKKLSIINQILLGVSIVSLLVNNSIENHSLIIGIPLGIALISWIASVIIGFIHWFKYSSLDTPNPIKTMIFYKNYFSNIGYGLFTGGIVTLVTTTSKITSWGLIILGFTSLVLSGIYENKHLKFKESIKGK